MYCHKGWPLPELIKSYSICIHVLDEELLATQACLPSQDTGSQVYAFSITFHS